MIQVDAIDIFIETDPNGEGEEGPGLISVRVPYDREFARQIKELGGKWDDQSKEWRLYGPPGLVKELAALCKTVFPKLPRRRNRLVAAQLSTSTGNSWKSEDKAAFSQLELVAKVQFVVNRTLKNYRLGQNLKWSREYIQIIEVPEGEKEVVSSRREEEFAKEILPGLPELERVAASAFEALLVGRKEEVRSILAEAEIKQG